jgi:hypothetical protein
MSLRRWEKAADTIARCRVSESAMNRLLAAALGRRLDRSVQRLHLSRKFYVSSSSQFA